MENEMEDKRLKRCEADVIVSIGGVREPKCNKHLAMIINLALTTGTEIRIELPDSNVLCKNCVLDLIKETEDRGDLERWKMKTTKTRD